MEFKNRISLGGCRIQTNYNKRINSHLVINHQEQNQKKQENDIDLDNISMNLNSNNNYMTNSVGLVKEEENINQNVGLEYD